MDGEKFRNIIQSGTDQYGSELWYFLRELAQNSRDAGSNNIRVTVGYFNENTEFIRFEDDGIGMSNEHANDYLFKLFASSKENQKNSIGKYGIGFWTVLKFDPYKIIIESKHKKNSWAIQLNPKLEIETILPSIKNRGTKITLLRIEKTNAPDNYLDIVKTELIKYCKYITKKNSFEPLPVLFNNKTINKKMTVEDSFFRKIKNKHLSGVVALGKEPMVMLYSKGLPIWNGSVLSDLTDHKNNNESGFETGKGLAPIFLLNSSNVDINYSRNTAIDNKNLARMISIAEKELSKLIIGFIKKTSPWSFFNTTNEVFKNTINKINKSLLLKTLILLIFLIPIEICFLNSFYSREKKVNINESELISNTRLTINKNKSALLVQKEMYSGASVHSDNFLQDLMISYTPAIDGLFKLYPASEYNTKHGFVHTNSFPMKNKQIIKQKGISFRLENIKRGKFFLLNKNNFRIDTSNIQLNGKTFNIKGIQNLADNTNQISLTDKNNLIEYQIFPLKNSNILSKKIQREYLRLPNILIPNSILNKLNEIGKYSLPEKIKKVESLTRELLQYDNSQKIINQYKLDQKSDWLKKILRIKAGDCDVINGLNTLLLRKINIPARLIIGFIGKKGKIIPQLHAWTEYYDKGWQTIDASIITAQPIVANKKKHKVKADKIIKQTTKKLYIKNDRLLQLIFIIFITLFSIFSIIIINKKKNKKKNIIMTQSLGEIALNALLYPEIWSSMNIWDYKFIPALGNKYLSLKNIKNKAKNGQLYKCTDNFDLSQNVIKKLFILDCNEKYYSNFIKILPNIIDLDRIDGLNIQRITEANFNNTDIKLLLEQTEILLNKSTKGLLKIFISTKLNETAFINIKLNKYIHPFTEQFVLINPEHFEIENFLIKTSNIKYSIFKLIAKILEIFELKKSDIILIQKRSSRLLLKHKT